MTPMIWSRLFDGQAGHVSEARRFARSVLDGRYAVELVELLVTELATNAILHTRSGEPGGWFVLHLILFPDRVRIRVFDLGGQNKPTRVETADDSELGRGLTIVNTFSLAWGVEGDQLSRIVWADVVQ